MNKKIKAVIFDFGYTIYDPEENKLLPNVVKTLKGLHNKGLKLAIMSRTTDPKKRIQQIKDLGLDRYFDFIDAIEKGGVKEFTPILDRFGFKPDEFLVVGDRITSEIIQGNKLGMNTVRFLYGPEKDLDPTKDEEKPDYTISNLKEVIGLIN